MVRVHESAQNESLWPLVLCMREKRIHCAIKLKSHGNNLKVD
jgi:hypothetical protein